MPCFPPTCFTWILLAGVIHSPLEAQVVAYDGFGSYAADAQVESGPDFSPGTGLDGGFGWAGAYDVYDNIKSKVRIENRSSNPAIFESGDIVILGGNRALRFYGNADGSYAVQRPLATVFDAAAGETLWVPSGL
jgi:hypothetical protein